jgi:hypothetical protein
MPSHESHDKNPADPLNLSALISSRMPARAATAAGYCFAVIHTYSLTLSLSLKDALQSPAHPEYVSQPVADPQESGGRRGALAGPREQ